MNNLEHIYTSRAVDPCGLPPQIKVAAAGDAGLTAGLAENRALQTLSAALPPPPDRARMLEAACLKSEDIKETSMSMITKALTHPKPALRLGLGLALLLAVLGISILLPQPGGRFPGLTPAYAAADGYMLLYVFECESPEQVQPLIAQLTAKVREFKLAHKLPIAEPGGQKLEKRRCEIKLENKQELKGADAAAGEKKKCRAVVAINLEDKTLLEELQRELAGIPGLPEPQITEATWFMQDNGPGPGGDCNQITIKLNDKEHTFSFPASASADEMKAALTAWLAENEPGVKFEVLVDKHEDAEGNASLTIKVQCPLDDAAEAK